MYKEIKRSLDLLFAIIGIISIFPIFIIIAVLIKAEDNGPIIFSQIRVGINGKHFKIYKFRSMKYQKSNYHSSGEFDSSKENLKSARIRYKTTELNDIRLTKVGKIIRSIHFDEIPQLINILKNQMSFVGPRPDVPSQQADYQFDQWEMRISVKPGLTGLAQISDISTPEDRNRFDNYYIENISFKLDFLILIKTFIKLFTKPSI